MLMTIRCPSCQIEGTMSFLESHYEGPYRCWKCRSLFTIELKNNKLISYESLSEEDLQKQQEAKAVQDKLNRQFPGRS
jgi:hypothetical protein